MKQFFLIAAAVLPMFVLSCEKQITDSPKNTTISFGIEQPFATKTDLQNTTKLVWGEGDEIYAQDNTWNWHVLTLSSGAGGTNATFSVDGDYTLLAGGALIAYGVDGHPVYVDNPNPQADYWTVNLPSTYQVSGDNIKVPLLAYNHNDVTERKFKMMSGALKVDIYDIPATACKLVLTANRKITGVFSVLSETVTASGTADSENTVTLNFTAGEATSRTFCFPLPACADGYSISLEFKNSADEVLATKSATLPAITSQYIVYAPAISLGSTPAETVLWKGLKAIGNWGYISDLSGAAFWSSLKAGKTLTVYFTEADDSGEAEPSVYRQLSLKTNTTGWPAIDGMSLSYNYTNEHHTSHSVVLTSDMVTTIKASGLIVSGYYVDVTKITLQ